MKALVVGSGGREHALAWKIAQSPLVTNVFVAPGNAGTANVGENVALGVAQHGELVSFAKRENIGLVVIGPDDALAAGLADAFREANLRVFGPNADAARIEASKSFAKDFMQRHRIPTAKSGTFEAVDSGLAFCDELGYPAVIKADGLALGKGVVIAESRAEAEATLQAMLVEGKFGEAGRSVVIEEFLRGVECSAHALVDASAAMLLELAQDHKQAFDGGRGPNTGGMGTISPPAFADEHLRAAVSRDILGPFRAGLKADRLDFRGLLFPGLMLTNSGCYVLEFNARFGDPETQVLLRRLKSDIVPYMAACAEGRLADCPPLEWDARTAVCVVMASGGYPGAYERGKPITGIEAAEQDADVVVFHAGTAVRDGTLVTNGGRVLGVTALGDSPEAARTLAYRAVKAISFEGSFHRNDIGLLPSS